jgi:hypothetical protein
MAMFPLVSPLHIAHGINCVYQHEITSLVFLFAEQFQKFLATQPHATFVSSIEGLTPLTCQVSLRGRVRTLSGVMQIF